MPELILSLRERELARVPVVSARTTIGRDPGNDVVIDNVGISRLHAAIEVIGDSFILRDCDSENGITLNGDPCREGRLVDGDIIGLNKFLVRFSNEALEDPANLPAKPERAPGGRPRDVQRTMHVDKNAAQALMENAKRQIARQRAENAARSGERAPELVANEPSPPGSLGWEEPEEQRPSLALVGALLIGGALIAGLLFIIL